jgi:hypothetical protein
VLGAEAGPGAALADLRDLEALAGDGGEGERGAQHLPAAFALRTVDRDQARHGRRGEGRPRPGRGGLSRG